jgi:hypothetical protein
MAMIARRNQEIFGCLNAKEQTALSAMLDSLIAHARSGVAVQKTVRAAIAQTPRPR